MNIRSSILFGIILFSLLSCKKEKLAEIEIVDVLTVQTSILQFDTDLKKTGNTPVTEIGLCYSETSIPDTSSNKESMVSTSIPKGKVTLTISDLKPLTQYNVRPYAVNSVGLAYGDVLTVNTGAGWGERKFEFNKGEYLDFVNENVGYVTGNNGVLYKTVDGGETFEQKNTQVTKLFNGICFLNENYGFVAQSSFNYAGRILRTTDGGDSWTNMLSSSGEFNFVEFYNEEIGFTASNNDVFYRTSDGGETWQNYDIPISDADDFAYRLHVVNDSVLYMLSWFGEFFKTTNAGESWVSHDIGFTVMFDMCFVSESIGYAISNGGLMIKTTDAGDTWTLMSDQDCCPKMLSFVSETEGYAAGPGLNVLHTIDGGATWTAVYSPESGSEFHAVQFINENTGFVTSWTRFVSFKGG